MKGGPGILSAVKLQTYSSFSFVLVIELRSALTPSYIHIPFYFETGPCF